MSLFYQFLIDQIIFIKSYIYKRIYLFKNY